MQLETVLVTCTSTSQVGGLRKDPPKKKLGKHLKFAKKIQEYKKLRKLKK